jgi:hypothetical protein
MRIMWHLEMLLFSGWLDCSEWNTKFTPSDESREPRQKSYTANPETQTKNVIFPSFPSTPSTNQPTFRHLSRTSWRGKSNGTRGKTNLTHATCASESSAEQTWNLVLAHQNKEHTSLPASRKTVRDIALR